MAVTAEALVLVGRSSGPPPADAPTLELALTADERTRLRGLRHTRCGRSVLLQLPRSQPLVPGEWLHAEPSASGPLPWVQVVAAPEPLMVVRAPDGLALLQAAYHLGNRHVAMEIHPQELRLLNDPVLAHLLEHRGLSLATIEAPFHPESGAYGHAHSHAPSNSHEH